MSETKTQVGQIRTEVHGHVFKIIIDNVAKKNSFSPQMMAQMSDAMTLLDRTDDYWVGVLCAEGPDFTAGLDKSPDRHPGDQGSCIEIYRGGRESGDDYIPEIRDRVFSSEDMKEGIQSFVERRSAVFRGK